MNNYKWPAERIRKLGSDIKHGFNKSHAPSTEARCYGIGIALVGIACILFLFKWSGAIGFAQIGAAVFACGLLPVIEKLYEWVWKRLLGKLVIAGLIALATNFAYGFGRQLVADVIGTNPAAFSSTVHVSTILISPILFLMVLAIGGFFIFILASYVGTLALAVQPMLSLSKSIRARFWICRFAALTIAVSGSWAALDHTSGYTDRVSKCAAWYLYTFDMYCDAHYSTNETEKTTILPDGRILLGQQEKTAATSFLYTMCRVNRINKHEFCREV